MALIKIRESYTYEIWNDAGTEILLKPETDFEDRAECFNDALKLITLLNLEGK